jgi:diacylglycerol kinase (ATP)
LNLKVERKIRFIINPISGGGEKDFIKSVIFDHLNVRYFAPEILVTTHPRHATTLSKQAVLDNIDAVIAIGGDGTVNEIASALQGSNTALGIIPLGSGNGVARHLNIPLEPVEAIKTINNYQTKWIDTITINEKLAVGVAGIGFDAHIGWEFSKGTKRGLSQYVKLSLKEYFKYEPKEIELKIEDEPFKKYNAFLLTIANTNQYGNNAFIAPNAKEDDGLLEVILLEKLPLMSAPKFAFDLFSKNTLKNNLVKRFSAKKVIIKHSSRLLHIDGEPLKLSKKLDIKVNPFSLKVIHNLG